MDTFAGNPIDNLVLLAKADVPILGVCDDEDDLVPYEENMEVLRSHYLVLGAPVEVILKLGVGHHPHNLDDPKPIVDFVLRQQPEYAYIIPCGELAKHFRQVRRERKDESCSRWFHNGDAWLEGFRAGAIEAAFPLY